MVKEKCSRMIDLLIQSQAHIFDVLVEIDTEEATIGSVRDHVNRAEIRLAMARGLLTLEEHDEAKTKFIDPLNMLIEKRQIPEALLLEKTQKEYFTWLLDRFVECECKR